MAWIESHQTLKTDPKLRRFCRALSVSRPTGIGMLHELWWFALDHAEDGNLSNIDKRDIALEMDLTEEKADDAWKALTETGPNGEHGFVESSGIIHAWDDYAGRLIRDRIRKRLERKPGSPTSVRGQSEDSARNVRATVPYPTQPNRTKQPTDGEEAAFEAFWKLYPRKTAKAAAFKAWKKVGPDAALQARIESAVRAQALCEQWTKDGGQFIPYPATWLNQGRWADELQARGSSNGRIVGAAAPTPGKFAHLGEKNG